MSNSPTKDPLIALLTGMPRVPEADFGARVMSRIHGQAWRRRIAYLTAWCCAVFAIFLSLPVERMLTPLASLTRTTQALWSELARFEQTSNFAQWQLQMGANNLLIVLIAAALVTLIASTTLLQD